MDKFKPIPQETVERVKERASIKTVIENFGGVAIHRYGSSENHYTSKSPFRPDKHEGSFHIYDKEGYAIDYATNETWDVFAATMLLEGCTFNEAVRKVAATCNVYIDDQPVPKVKKVAIKLKQTEEKELPTLLFADVDRITKPYLKGLEESKLVSWLRTIGLNKDKLNWALDAYKVGVATKGEFEGWTVWWQINEFGYLQTGHIMAYMPDGHRDKRKGSDGKDKSKWAHTFWMYSGWYDHRKYKAKTIMFGLHLLYKYKNAQVSVVESEKTALIMSTFYDPKDMIWMATSGLGTLKNRLPVLIREGRDIILWPDKDGFEKWKAEAEKIGYERMRVLTPEQQGWKEEDGPKADVADIMVRRLTTTTTTTTIGQRVAIMAGMPEKAGDLDHLIEALDLVEENV